MYVVEWCKQTSFMISRERCDLIWLELVISVSNIFRDPTVARHAKLMATIVLGQLGGSVIVPASNSSAKLWNKLVSFFAAVAILARL